LKEKIWYYERRPARAVLFIVSYAVAGADLQYLARLGVSSSDSDPDVRAFVGAVVVLV
jgi:hypothetical protein